MLSKNKLMIALIASTIGLAACSEPQQDAAEDVKEVAMEVVVEAKEETGDMLDSATQGAEEMKDDAVVAYDEAEEGAVDKLDDAKESAGEMKDAAAQEVKEACIAAKTALGQSTDDC
jgi:hypothetical protein